MQLPSDQQLLDQFAKTGSHDAFAVLVRRHAGLVFAAASRQVRDFAAAQDVSQVVFMVLARKAGSIGPRVPLSAFLLNVTRFASLDYLESQARRVRHEHGAAAMAAVSKTETDDRWNDISPYLDEAMGRLSTPTRSAIVLRFFENLSFAEISKRLNISVDAAKQRVSRGLKQLRSSFAMHSVAVTDTALLTMLQAHAVSHAPVGLAAKLAIAAHAAASPSHLAATKGVLILMAMSKAKSVAIVAIIIALLGTATAVTYHAINVNTTKTIVIEKPLTGAPTVDTTNPASDITTPQAAGIVVGPDGKAIAGAQVNLLTQSRQFDIYGTEVDHSKP